MQPSLRLGRRRFDGPPDGSASRWWSPSSPDFFVFVLDDYIIPATSSIDFEGVLLLLRVK